MVYISTPTPWRCRVASYRALSALAVRHWCAAEVAAHRPLLDRLADPRSESSAQACHWRFASVQVLMWTAPPFRPTKDTHRHTQTAIWRPPSGGLRSCIKNMWSVLPQHGHLHVWTDTCMLPFLGLLIKILLYFKFHILKGRSGTAVQLKLCRIALILHAD